MITITPATIADAAAVAALWNAKATDADSCWFAAPVASGASITELMAGGLTFALALQDSVPASFGFWREARLNAFAPTTPEVYYRLMLAWVSENLAAGRSDLIATIGARQTTEYGWLTVLTAVTLVPVGFEPIAIGQPIESRVVTVLDVTADATVLHDNLVAVLGGFDGLTAGGVP